jgi:hypothetical protein
VGPPPPHTHTHTHTRARTSLAQSELQKHNKFVVVQSAQQWQAKARESASSRDSATEDAVAAKSGSDRSSWAPGDIVTVVIPRGPNGIGMKLVEDDGSVFVTKTVKGSTSEQVLGTSKALGPNGLQILRVFGSEFVGKSECVELVKSQPDTGVELELRVLDGYGDDGGEGDDAELDPNAEERQQCVKILSQVRCAWFSAVVHVWCWSTSHTLTHSLTHTHTSLFISLSGRHCDRPIYVYRRASRSCECPRRSNQRKGR